MLEIKDLYVRKVLKGLNLTAKSGEFITIVGENGAGKTTLFSTIAGILKPASGEIYIDNQNIRDLPKRELSSMVSSVLQDPKAGTIADMTILENLTVACQRGKKRYLKISHGMTDFFKEKLSILKMGLENRMEEYVRNLSGGQRQALNLIMATLTGYKVLLLDEITAALDPESAALVMNKATALAKEAGKICIAITHNEKFIGTMGNVTLKLKDGKLCEIWRKSN